MPSSSTCHVARVGVGLVQSLGQQGPRERARLHVHALRESQRLLGVSVVERDVAGPGPSGGATPYSLAVV